MLYYKFELYLHLPSIASHFQGSASIVSNIVNDCEIENYNDVCLKLDSTHL